MRQIVFLAGSLLALISCNNKSGDTMESKADSNSTGDNVTYAYTTPQKPDWEMGKPEHVAIVLNSLKAYENRNLDEALKAFADSVEFYADGFSFVGTKDSLAKIFKRDLDQMQSMSIEMHDWESVHGRKNNEDWVSLWYKSTWTDKSGKVDSLIEMDDAKIVDGKIRVLDIKVRHFPKK